MLGLGSEVLGLKMFDHQLVELYIIHSWRKYGLTIQLGNCQFHNHCQRVTEIWLKN
jgi:hypothetical protein